MKTLARRAASAFALAALTTLLHTAPAQAMGRSGSQASTPHPSAQPSERRETAGAGVQIQIDTLRKEIADLRAQMVGSVATK